MENSYLYYLEQCKINCNLSLIHIQIYFNTDDIFHFQLKTLQLQLAYNSQYLNQKGGELCLNSLIKLNIYEILCYNHDQDELFNLSIDNNEYQL